MVRPGQAGRQANGTAKSRRPAKGVAAVLLALGDSPAAVFVVSLVAIVFGALIVDLADPSLRTLAVLGSVPILVVGAHCFAQAIASDDRGTGRRTLVTMGGIVAVVVGALVLRDDTHTAVTLGMLLGLFWLVNGVIAIVASFVGPAASGRAPTMLAGALGIAVGIGLVAYPAMPYHGLVLVLGSWLMAYGVLAAATAWQVWRGSAA
jgi:hypothetical protein